MSKIDLLFMKGNKQTTKAMSTTYKEPKGKSKSSGKTIKRK